MKKIDFNSGWRYARVGESEFTEVTLPHDAMISEPRVDTSAGGTNTGWFEEHDYVYISDFDVPASYKGKTVLIEFEGVYQNAEVYINGEKVCERPYGYINFFVDASQHFKCGQTNEIKVIAHNVNQPSSRWYTGAGLYRPVWLYVADDLHILPNGVKVRTLSINPAKVEVTVLTSGAGSVTVEIDGHSQTIETDGKAVVTFDIADAKLWDCDNPNLYECNIQFAADTASATFGIRTIAMNAKDGFLLNGKRTILRGCCVHHDNGILGAIAHPFADDRKVKLLKDAGYNAIRSSHNPCSVSLLDACDRNGMLMMDELVDMWYIHKTKYDYATHFDQWWKTDLKALIERDYNHPSVIMYSMGNEVSETAQKRGIALSKEMTEFCHEHDADRFVTCGINIMFNLLSSMGFGIYTDKKADAAVKPSKPKKKAVGSEFFNNLANFFGSGFMKWGATFPGCNAKTKHAFAEFDAAGYNYGVNRYKRDVKKHPNRVIIGSETFPYDAYKFYEFAKTHPSLIGDFVWTGIDYLGEVGLGAWEYHDYAPDFGKGVGWIAAGSGRLDITGKGNGETAFTKVAYEQEDIKIAVQPVSKNNDKHSSAIWRMTNAIESWSWNNLDGSKAIVEVYARAHKVKLYINDKLVGTKKAKKTCRFVFKTKYYDGEVKAVALDKKGNEIAHTTLKTANDDTSLQLRPELNEILRDGLCYVRMVYADANGTIKPLARGDIKVSVKGGKLLAAGNGCAYNERGYCTDTTDTYYGEAIAIIQPTGGDIKITADSDYGNATVTVKVI